MLGRDGVLWQRVFGPALVVLVVAEFYSVFTGASFKVSLTWALIMCFLYFIARPRVRQWRAGRMQRGDHSPPPAGEG